MIADAYVRKSLFQNAAQLTAKKFMKPYYKCNDFSELKLI